MTIKAGSFAEQPPQTSLPSSTHTEAKGSIL